MCTEKDHEQTDFPNDYTLNLFQKVTWPAW